MGNSSSRENEPGTKGGVPAQIKISVAQQDEVSEPYRIVSPTSTVSDLPLMGEPLVYNKLYQQRKMEEIARKKAEEEKERRKKLEEEAAAAAAAVSARHQATSNKKKPSLFAGSVSSSAASRSKTSSKQKTKRDVLRYKSNAKSTKTARQTTAPPAAAQNEKDPNEIPKSLYIPKYFDTSPVFQESDDPKIANPKEERPPLATDQLESAAPTVQESVKEKAVHKAVENAVEALSTEASSKAKSKREDHKTVIKSKKVPAKPKLKRPVNATTSPGSPPLSPSQRANLRRLSVVDVRDTKQIPPNDNRQPEPTQETAAKGGAKTAASSSNFRFGIRLFGGAKRDSRDNSNESSGRTKTRLSDEAVVGTDYEEKLASQPPEKPLERIPERATFGVEKHRTAWIEEEGEEQPEETSLLEEKADDTRRQKSDPPSTPVLATQEATGEEERNLGLTYLGLSNISKSASVRHLDGGSQVVHDMALANVEADNMGRVGKKKRNNRDSRFSYYSNAGSSSRVSIRSGGRHISVAGSHSRRDAGVPKEISQRAHHVEDVQAVKQWSERLGLERHSLAKVSEESTVEKVPTSVEVIEEGDEEGEEEDSQPSEGDVHVAEEEPNEAAFGIESHNEAAYPPQSETKAYPHAPQSVDYSDGLETSQVSGSTTDLETLNGGTKGAVDHQEIPDTTEPQDEQDSPFQATSNYENGNESGETTSVSKLKEMFEATLCKQEARTFTHESESIAGSTAVTEDDDATAPLATNHPSQEEEEEREGSVAGSDMTDDEIRERAAFVATHSAITPFKTTSPVKRIRAAKNKFWNWRHEEESFTEHGRNEGRAGHEESDADQVDQETNESVLSEIHPLNPKDLENEALESSSSGMHAYVLRPVPPKEDFDDDAVNSSIATDDDIRERAALVANQAVITPFKTTSPVKRITKAKNRFANSTLEASQLETTQSETSQDQGTDPAQLQSEEGFVKNQISEINCRLQTKRKPVWKIHRRETSGSNVLAPRKATLINPMFRQPQLLDAARKAKAVQQNRVVGPYLDLSYASSASDETSQYEEIGTERDGRMYDHSSLHGRYDEDNNHDRRFHGEETHYYVDSTNEDKNGYLQCDMGAGTEEHESLQSFGTVDLASGTQQLTTDSSRYTRKVSKFSSKDHHVADIEAGSTSSSYGDNVFSRYAQKHNSSDEEDEHYEDDRGARMGDDTNHVEGTESILLRADDRRSNRPKRLKVRWSMDTVSNAEDPTSDAVSRDGTEPSSVGDNIENESPNHQPMFSSTIKAAVNPDQIYKSKYLTTVPEEHHHQPGSTSDLCLSPLQRTPLQARKWRTLAAEAAEKDAKANSGAKKGSGAKKKKKGTPIKPGVLGNGYDSGGMGWRRFK